MMIYDTAGQEEYGALTRSHFHGAGAAILVFSSTDRNSFLAIKDWKERVIADCDENIPIVMLMRFGVTARIEALLTELTVDGTWIK